MGNILQDGGGGMKEGPLPVDRIVENRTGDDTPSTLRWHNRCGLSNYAVQVVERASASQHQPLENGRAGIPTF
jgi:hypothetical protein